MRACAFSVLTAWVCRDPGFLIACASSRTTSDHSRARSASTRASVPYVVMTRSVPPRSAPAMSPISSRASPRDAPPASRETARSARSRPASWRGATPAPRAGSAARHPAPALAQEDQHLDRLAEPHVVRQADAEPQRRRERQPRHARLLVGPQRAVQIGARVGRGEAARRAQPLERFPSHSPASTRDQPSPVASARTRRQPRRRRRAGAYPPGTTAPRAPPGGARAPVDRAPRGAARDPARPTVPAVTPASPMTPWRRISTAVSIASPRATDTEKSSSASMPTALGFLSPTRTATSGRGGRRAPPVGHAHDQPRRLEGRDRLQESVRLGRRPRHRLVDRTGLDELGEPRESCCGALQGTRRWSRARRSPRAEESSTPAPVADAAPCRRRRRAPRRWRGSRTDAPRRRGSRLEVQANLADDVPRA